MILTIAVGIYFNVVGAEVEVSPIEDFKLFILVAELDITPSIAVSAVVKRDARLVTVPFKVVILLALVILLFVIVMTSAISLKSVLELSEPRIVDIDIIFLIVIQLFLL